VVVIGGGFAGLSALRELGKVDVDITLIDQHAYNTFQPLLYQVATGGLNPAT
jgi:NADH dehydrogenase